MGFRARLFQYPGPAGWHFIKVPKAHAPPPTHAFGRTPVTATVDGIEFSTSVWWDTKTESTLLAVPARVRKEKRDGDTVLASIVWREASAHDSGPGSAKKQRGKRSVRGLGRT